MKFAEVLHYNKRQMAYLKDLISNAQIVGERDFEVERRKTLQNFIKS
jgi:hypothetical protein